MPETLTEKIKMFTSKIKTSIRRNMCYNDMESEGIAVFGMCAGAATEYYRKCNCYDCPYFRDIYAYKERNNNVETE